MQILFRMRYQSGLIVENFLSAKTERREMQENICLRCISPKNFSKVGHWVLELSFFHVDFQKNWILTFIL